MCDIYAASLCRQGILGGAVCLKADRIIYKTNKVSAAPQYRRVEMKYSDIDGIDKGRQFLFPTVTVKKKNGNNYKFVMFNRKQFLNRYQELKNDQQ